MARETEALCDYAAALTFADLPPAVVRRATDCIVDTVGGMIQGRDQPWSRKIAALATRTGGSGRSHLFGHSGGRVQAPAAALANGVMAHAFEMDSLTYPSAGTHPGANLVPAGLAVAQEVGASGRDLISAVVAGCEVVNRIGRACHPVNPAFHQPGILGPLGGAVVAGRLLGLDAAGLGRALGLAGSMGCGLMAFAHSRDGAMVKKLHIGRAAESGVLAALLAADGFTGPSGVLESGGGVLAAFSPAPDRDALLRGLGTEYETLTISLKRFAAHITAHTPVQALLELRAAHDFAPEDIARAEVHGSPRMAQHNSDRAPADLMMAQYSVPFCLALAAFRDPADPASFDESALADPRIAALCGQVQVVAAPPAPDHPLRSRLTLTLRDGRTLSHTVDSYPGTPLQPLDEGALRQRFLACAGSDLGTRLFPRLFALPDQAGVDFIQDGPASGAQP